MMGVKGTSAARWLVLVGIFLLWAGYPLCVALGLDGCVGWLSNGYLPGLAELVGAVIVLFARVLQCVVAPVLLLAWLGWGCPRCWSARPVR